jgi:hypothetical protein
VFDFLRVTTNATKGVTKGAKIVSKAAAAESARRKKVATTPTAKTRGIIARDQSGKRVILPGPPKPIQAGTGRYIHPQYQFSDQVVSRPKAKAAFTPRVEGAMLAPIPGSRPTNKFSDYGYGKGAAAKLVGLKPLDQWGDYRWLDKNFRAAIELQQARTEIEMGLRRAQYQSPFAYLGRTISNAADFGQRAIEGLPAAAWHGATETFPNAMKVLGLVPGTTASDQIEAGKDLYQQDVKPTVKYYGTLAKDSVLHPIDTFEKRGLEQLLAAAAAWNAGGMAVRGVAVGAGSAGRLGAAIGQAGSVRGGVRVARGASKARAAERVREVRGVDPSRPAGAPSQTTFDRQYRFVGSKEQREAAAQAVAVTGNKVAGRISSALQDIGDWGSKSRLPGSPRYRDPRSVAAPTRDRSGRLIGEVDAQGNPVYTAAPVEIPRRPYSPNPLSRIVQKRFLEPAGNAVGNPLLSLRDKIPLIPSAAESAFRATARDMTYEIPEGVDATVATVGRPFAKLVNSLKGSATKSGLPASEVAQGVAAAALRAMGAAEGLGGSRVWGRDVLLARLKKTLAENAPKKRGERKAIENQITTLESIPDEWLDPATAPKRINDLSVEAAKVLRYSTDTKRAIGLISGSSANWAGVRTQAQLLGARPLANLRAEVMAPVDNDLAMVRAIQAELDFRRTNSNRGKSHGERFSNYSTPALRTIQLALGRRAKTIRGRVTPYVKRAEENALAPYADLQAAERKLAEAKEALKNLSQYRGTADIDERLIEARAELKNRLDEAKFDRDRAVARARMASQGSRAMERAAFGRARRAEAAARRDAAAGEAPRSRTVEPSVRLAGFARGRVGYGSQQARRASAAASTARGELRGVPPTARPAYNEVMRLKGQRTGARRTRVGTPAQISAARTAVIDANDSRNTIRDRAYQTAYYGHDLPRRAGLEPGEYFPHQSIAPDAARIFAESGNGFRGAGAGMNPQAEQFNTGTLLARGDIDLSARPIVSALRSAVDARERTRVASGIVEKFAVRDQNGRLLEGEEPVKAFVDSSGGLYQRITGRQLASITSLSMDTAEGQTLRRLLDESLGSDANKVYAIPTAVMKGWNDVLAPAGPGKIIDQIYSLWKGGVLALSPRWYFQNFVGMWGQFALGAGADLQAITMARNPAYADTLPGRIAQSGLADDLGEYARQSGGKATNPFGRLMRGGFSLNAMFEGVPRKAMFWASTKRTLAENKFLRRDTMDEGGLAKAWLDVAQAPQKFGKIAAAARRRADVATDPAIKARYLEQARIADLNAKGANAIIDDAINVTERFMGNYSRYNALEKKILKRVFPFYGWMRAIHRLAFALPVKHPKRTALLASASAMAYEMYGLERNDFTDPRAGFFKGNLMFGTSTLNPFMSIEPTLNLINTVGQNIERANGLVGLPSELALSLVDAFKAAAKQSGPLYEQQYRALSGKSIGGTPTVFSPGYQGYAQDYRGQYFRQNPSTGQLEYGTPTQNPIASIIQSFPVVNAIRQGLAGGRPYADASELDLLGYRFGGSDSPEDRARLVQNNPKMPRVLEPTGYSTLTNILLGVPVFNVNSGAAVLQEYESLKRYIDGLDSTQRKLLTGLAQAKARG